MAKKAALEVGDTKLFGNVSAASGWPKVLMDGELVQLRYNDGLGAEYHVG